MKEISDPGQLVWFPFSVPLPNPKTIHPDCRIIVFQKNNNPDLSQIKILAPKLDFAHNGFSKFHWVYVDGTYWENNRAKTASYETTHWAWLISFH